MKYAHRDASKKVRNKAGFSEKGTQVSQAWGVYRKLLVGKAPSSVGCSASSPLCSAHWLAKKPLFCPCPRPCIGHAAIASAALKNQPAGCLPTEQLEQLELGPNALLTDCIGSILLAWLCKQHLCQREGVWPLKRHPPVWLVR